MLKQERIIIHIPGNNVRALCNKKTYHIILHIHTYVCAKLQLTAADNQIIYCRNKILKVFLYNCTLRYLFKVVVKLMTTYVQRNKLFHVNSI